MSTKTLIESERQIFFQTIRRTAMPRANVYKIRGGTFDFIVGVSPVGELRIDVFRQLDNTQPANYYLIGQRIDGMVIRNRLLILAFGSICQIMESASV